MTENLNRAFIRAYTKEKASELQRKNAADEKSQRDLIMQFDTATVEIPRPHFLDSKQRAAEHTMAESRTGSVASSAERMIRKPAPDEELRASIAAQMLQSSAWEPQWADKHIDAFMAGFPMISTLHSPATTSESSKIAKAATDLPVGERSDNLRGDVSSSVSANKDASSGEPYAGQASPEIPHPTACSEQGAQSCDGAQPESLPIAAPQLEKPTAAALSNDQLADHIAVELAAKVQRKNRDGEIFRLDRPSYTPTASVDAMAFEEDLSAGSITHIDALRDEAKVRASADSKARQVEEVLRKARVKIFNPVWEVDNLQWPPVCVELIDQMTHSMNRVAENLMAACQDGLQILAVTSPKSGEGSTTVACCLAMLAGSHGLNVAIVDGDIENPSLCYQTNLDLDQDWRAAIMNQVPVEEVAVHSINDQVTLVPLLSPISNQEMSIDDDRISTMLQELSESFDLVIVDMGDMESTRNMVTSLGEQGLISAVVAVVDRRNSTRDRIDACLRRIRQSGIASIGLVENFAA